MGLRCLLGHDFDEPETERERNEEGNEVVVTVREVKTCTRCGEKQVVSENKEITSIDQLRESATGEPASEPTDDADTAGSSTPTDDTQWTEDDLSTGQSEDASAATEPSATEASTTKPEQTDSTPDDSVADSETDAIDRGVADIIEQAEKDDDMLETEPEDDTESTDDVPVHPGQRGPDADDAPAPKEDDGVILNDDGSQPEEARRQWEEEASPEEVPGDDLSVGESSTPASDGEDAEIIDAGPEATDTESPTSEPSTDERTTDEGATTAEPEPSEGSTVIEGEDAEIMDAGPESSAEPESEPSAEPERDPEPTTEPEREETDEGHMPWPDAPGEDEGHDASAPDGEPADVDFGGGLAPEDAGSEESSRSEPTQSEPTQSEPTESEPTQSETRSEPGVKSEPDRANGHRTEAGEPGDASATPSSNVDLEQSSRDAGMEYFCPECGLTRDVGNSSMRAGDICPECRKGYITEQQKAE